MNLKRLLVALAVLFPILGSGVGKAGETIKDTGTMACVTDKWDVKEPEKGHKLGATPTTGYFEYQNTDNHTNDYYAFAFLRPGTLTVSVPPIIESPPVPLPAALPLLASGLGGIGLMGWWRRRRRIIAR